MNELYQKSKKLSKKGERNEKAIESQFPPVPEEEEMEADTNAQEVETETKKDK